MADYLPLFKPGQDITSTLTADCTGGQLLVVSGSGTAAPSTAATGAWLGVAAFDAASGARVAIHKGGVQRLTAAGAIAAGDRVIPAAGGTVATLGAGTDYSQVVGIALTSAADGAAVDVDFIR
jgi:predicted RecA/RadA family phage recombinase